MKLVNRKNPSEKLTIAVQTVVYKRTLYSSKTNSNHGYK